MASYNAGASFNTLHAAGIGFVAPAFTSTTHHITYPMYESYSLAVEQQLDPKTVVSVSYVGNHGYHEPILNAGINAYGFGSLPDAAPQGSFGAVIDVNNFGGSNYNGGIVTVTRREKLINLQFNYLYSHAFDVVSNGGFNPFSSNPQNPENPYNISPNYGPADYDVRNYISASYVINVPQFGKWRALTGGWTIGGTVFHSSSLPFTVIDSATPSKYGTGLLFAQQLSKGFSNKCQGAAAVDTPCAAGAPGGSSAGYANFDVASDFGQQRRNQFVGSGYTDTDLDLTKGFKIPHWESANLKVGAQFFNLFNHPNFGQPLNDVESTGLGTINSLVSTPTSILGSGLGGDASPRPHPAQGQFHLLDGSCFTSRGGLSRVRLFLCAPNRTPPNSKISSLQQAQQVYGLWPQAAYRDQVAGKGGATHTVRAATRPRFRKSGTPCSCPAQRGFWVRILLTPRMMVREGKPSLECASRCRLEALKRVASGWLLRLVHLHRIAEALKSLSVISA